MDMPPNNLRSNAPAQRPAQRIGGGDGTNESFIYNNPTVSGVNGRPGMEALETVQASTDALRQYGPNFSAMRLPAGGDSSADAQHLAYLEEGRLPARRPQEGVSARVMSANRLFELFDEFGDSVELSRSRQNSAMSNSHSAPALALEHRDATRGARHRRVAALQRRAAPEVAPHTLSYALSRSLSQRWSGHDAGNDEASIQPAVIQEDDAYVLGGAARVETGESPVGAEPVLSELPSETAPTDPAAQQARLPRQEATLLLQQPMDSGHDTNNRSVQWSHAEIFSLTGSMENIVALMDYPQGTLTEETFTQRDIETGHGAERETGLPPRPARIHLLGTMNPYVTMAPSRWRRGGGHLADLRQNATVPVQSRAPIRDFLRARPDAALSRLIQRLSQFGSWDLTRRQVDQLSDRIAHVIAFVDDHAETERVALENIAEISIVDCHDGGLGGLIAIEHFIAETQLVEDLKLGTLDAKTLYSNAQQHYASQCIKRCASQLTAALGSTREALEVELLLIRHLGDRLSLPVKNDVMQNPLFAEEQFHRAMPLVFGQLCESEQLTDRMAFLAQRLSSQFQDKQQVLQFMSGWMPAQMFVALRTPRSNADEVQDLSAPHAHLEQVISLSEKAALNGEDRKALAQTLNFLAEHKSVIAESVYLKITSALQPLETLDALPLSAVTALSAALQAVHENAGAAPYLAALEEIYG